MLSHVVSPTYMDFRELRAAAALELLSAWDTPLEVQCSGMYAVMLYTSYTADPASLGGGIVEYRIETSPDGTTWYALDVYADIALVSGTDTVSNFQRGLIDYGAVGATQELFTIGPLALNGCAEFFRVAVREIGDAVNPGVVDIYAVFSFAKE